MRASNLKAIKPRLFHANQHSPSIDFTGLELHRVWVVTPGSDLRSTQVNPASEYLGSIWLMGVVRYLPFDPREWKLTTIHPLKEAEFFYYSTHHGYRIALACKS
jgi:hypothetical protein